MPAKRRRAKHKPVDDEDALLPGERQRARFPAQWERHTKAQRLVMETRARQLREHGWGAISWDELTGRQ